MRKDPALDTTIVQIRRRLVDDMHKIIIVLAIPALTASLYRIQDTGWTTSMLVHIAAAILVWCLFLFRNRVRFWIRSSVLLSLFFILGINGFLNYGLSGAGPQYIIVFVVLATLFSGLRGGLAALAAAVALIIGLSVAVIQHWVTFTIDFKVYNEALSSWILLIARLGILIGAVVIVADRLYSALIHALSTAQRQTNEIQQRAVVLQAEITERERAEDALRESEERYRNGFENHAAVMLLIDPDNGEIIEANEAAVNYYGWSHERLKKMKIQEINTLPPEDVKKEMKNVHTEKSIHFEFRHRRADGSIRDVEVFSSKISVKGKDLLHSIIHDITDRKQAEEALRQSEEKYRLIAENTADVISINDMNLRFTYVSPSIMRIRGFTVEEAMEQTLDQIMTPESLKIALATFDEEIKLEASGIADPVRIRTMELEEYRKDGSIIRVEASLSFLRDKDHKPVAVLATTRDITERKWAEDALRRNEQTLRRTFDQAPLGAAIMSLGNRFLHVNAELCRITGYSEQELLALDFPAITHPEDLERNVELTRDMVAGKFDSFQMDKRYLRKDGKIIWVRLFARIVKDASGKPLHFFPMVEDITDRRQAEEALRKSEESSRRLAEENAVMAEIGRIISSNPDIQEVFKLFTEKAKSLLPYDRISINLINKDGDTLVNRYVEGDTAPGRNVGEVFPMAGTLTERVIQSRKGFLFGSQDENEVAADFPGLVPEVRAAFRSFLSIPLISRDQPIGALHFRSKKYRAYEDKDLKVAETIAAQIAGAIANAQLFSERKRAEEALRESEEKYRSLVANAMDAIFIAQDEKIKFPNPKTLALSGYSEEELSRMPFINIVHPDDRKAVLDRYRRRIAGENLESVQTYRCLNRAGEVVWVQVNAVLTLWEGRPATINFLRDITHEKMLEGQLLQAQKVEAIGTLAGGIAHDFNNILSAIIGYAELAGFDIPENSQAKYNLEQSLKASQRAKDLVQQILAFSRQGKQERKLLNPKPLIQEGLKLLRASLPATIEIRQDIEKDLGTIKADPTQIHQVLMNLCTNASHAMSEHGGVLEVSLSKVDTDGSLSASSAGIEPGPYLRFRVSDTGHGMAPDVLKRIFDPYFTTKEVGKGTGLGLAVVHGIVKSHGGGIAVFSEPGKGTTFDVYLPRVEAFEAPSATDKMEAIIPGGQERVLLVDDEQAIVEIGQRLLEYLGYQVVVRTSSLEALELFRGRPDRFDLVITDMTMPNMTGDRFAREIWKIRPGIPVILCTGFSERITEEKAKAMGIREFVMKPLVIKDLAQALRRALGSLERNKG